MLTKDELIEALASSPSPNRITPEYLNSRIGSVAFLGPKQTDGTLTICIITMDNGFTVNGSSACADPANYNREIGEKIAYDDAERQIWPLLGFMLKEIMSAKAILNQSQANLDELKKNLPADQ